MNPYMARPASLEACQPGVMLNAQIYCFGLGGDLAAIDSCADRYLNAAPASTLKYKAALDVVMLTFMDAEKLMSVATGPGDAYGWVHDVECAFWVLLAAGTEDASGEFHPQRLVWWMPYVIVDTSVAMVTGREVWGFPKDVGTFHVPPAPTTSPALLAVDTRVFPTIDPSTQGTVQRLVTVEQRQPPPGVLEQLWEDVTEVGRGLKTVLVEGAELGEGKELLELAMELAHFSVPVTNLKQFRDCADGSKACYQALVESTCTVNKIHGGGFLSGKYDVTIGEFASHPIVTDLGLAGSRTTAQFATWVRQDFEAATGTTVWEAPA
jgi:hypothetical protein